MAVQVFRFKVGTEFDQKLQNVVAIPIDSKVNWSQTPVEPGQAPSECFWILMDHGANQLQIPERHSGKNVMMRAPFRQERCNFRDFTWLSSISVKECRPTDGIQFVIVINAVHVATGLEQHANDIELPVRRCPMKRIGMVSGFARVGIRTALQKQSHNVKVAMLSGRMQAGPSAMSRCSIRGANKIGVIGKQSTNSLDVAPGARFEEERIRTGKPQLDRGSQRPPTGESIFTRDDELHGR
jgi:hypothetical protein